MSAHEAHNEAFETARGTVAAMIQTMKKTAVGVFAAVAFCLALTPAVAWAALDPEVTLTKVDGEDAVAVSLIAPDEPRDDVRALSLSLQVTGVDPSKTAVSFAFDDSLKNVAVTDARVVQDQNTYRVNLYMAMAHDNALYSGDQVSLGKVVLTGADNTRAEVSVLADSLQQVNAAHVRDIPTFHASDPVTVELGKATNPDTPNPDNPNPDTPDPDKPSTGDGDDNKTDDTTNNDPNDTSGSNPDANRSLGAPSGTDYAPVSTGDNLTGIVIVLAASLAVAAVVLVIIFVRRSRTH